MTKAVDTRPDLITETQITNYSFISEPFKLNKMILHCVTGLGPSGNDSTVLGGWYFNGAKIVVRPLASGCGESVFEARTGNTSSFPGLINLFHCQTFTTTKEGVYECRMMNSSMMKQTMRVGVYFSGRSESLDMYPSPHC